MRKRIKKNGFTLTELLIVLGIIAVMTAIAIPVTIGIMNQGNKTSEDVNTALYTSIMKKYSAEKVGVAGEYPRLTTLGANAEYPIFAEKAGQGTYPGYNIIAGPTNGDVIAQIRKEAVIAIKAFSDTAVSEDYYINPPADADYEYVYYYLTGDVKKHKRSSLKMTSADDFISGEINIDDYWVYLSRDGGSGAALGGVSNGTGHLFVRVTQFGTGLPLDGATVTVTSGASTFSAVTKGNQNGFVGFSGIPEGSVQIAVTYNGAVNFPNRTYYDKNGTVIISPSGYEGCQMNAPYSVEMKLGSLGSLGFYEENLIWDNGEWRTERKPIVGSVVATSDFTINTNKHGGYPRAEQYVSNLYETNGKQELLTENKFLTYGHYHLAVSAYGYRTHYEDVEAKIFGISDYEGIYDERTSPYEYPITMKSPFGKGIVSGIIECESLKQPLYDVPESLSGENAPFLLIAIDTRVVLINLDTGDEYYSDFFTYSENGKYSYSIENLPDGEYEFEIDSPYSFNKYTNFPSTITVDGRNIIVSGKIDYSDVGEGDLNGNLFYDYTGKYAPVYDTSITFERFDGISSKQTVTTDEYGNFVVDSLKCGFYRITVKMPDYLGGYEFFYKGFITDSNYTEFYLNVPTKNINGYLIPLDESQKTLEIDGVLSGAHISVTRTNENGSEYYGISEPILYFDGYLAQFDTTLVPGFYLIEATSPCFNSNCVLFYVEPNEINNIDFSMQMNLDTNSKENHCDVFSNCDDIAHWEECSNCRYKFDYSEHNSSDWTYYSTSGCYRYCIDCAYQLTEITPHSVDSYVSKAATCTADGEKTYYCDRGCGYSYTETVTKTGHIGNETWVYDNNNTHHQNCSVCNTVLNSGTTCTRGGMTNNTSNHFDSCKICGGRRYYDHTWKETSRSGYACTGGTIYYKCNACSATKTGSYAATATHNSKARCSTKHAATWTSYCSSGSSHKWNGYYHILCSVCGGISESSRWCAMHCGNGLVVKPCPG